MGKVVGNKPIKNFEFLYRLVSTRSPKKRWAIVQNATRDELLTIVEICSNIMTKHFSLTPSQSKRLSRYAGHVQKLGRVRTPTSALKVIQSGEGIHIDLNAKRKRDRFRVQSGGFVQFLPALLTPILVELASTGIEKLANHMERVATEK